MSDVAIRVKNLSKRYRIGLKEEIQDTFVGAMTAWLKSPLANFRRLRKLSSFSENGHDPDDIIWALKDVSFEVKRGEVVGIIGRNGAGKSTLLKILSRITEPTNGRVELNGRVSSLLEVGTGFHPELTGRENVYLNGTVLGMSKVEVDRKFDEMVAFSGVEKFIDTPVKRYSSGMKVRLAFSVAAHLEPEILLVDEVLAVGDIGFQKKCLGKMEDVAEGGRTVLFVSHNMGMITTLCEKAILLREGRIDFISSAQQAVRRYLAHFSADVSLKREWNFEEASGGENIKVKSVTISDIHDVQKPYFSTTEPIFVTIEYWVLSDDVPVNVDFWLFDEQGNWICGSGNYKETMKKAIKKRGTYSSKCTITANLLNSGKHTITIHGLANISDIEVTIPHCVAFETVEDQRLGSSYSKWGGIIKPDFEWQSERIRDVERMRVHDS